MEEKGYGGGSTEVKGGRGTEEVGLQKREV